MTCSPMPPARAATSNLDDYFGQIRNEALLTAADEQMLAEAIARGDSEARSRLITANLRLVIKIARGYLGRGVPLEDLVGEGNLGLIRAVEGYDPGYGTRFSTYAAYWIRQSIGQALANTAALIRLPAHVVVLLSKWRRAERRLHRENGHAPSPDRITAELGLRPAQRALIERAIHSRRLIHEGSDETPSWSCEATVDRREQGIDALEAAEERGGVLRLLGVLDEREQMVLGLRFGLAGDPPQTLIEVGRRLGVTREWVRKIELRALQKLGEQYASAEAVFLKAIRAYTARKGRDYAHWEEVIAVADALGFTTSDPAPPGLEGLCEPA